MKILYVEDSPNDADLAQRHLRKHAPQFALEVVSTQSEAVARLSGPDTPPYDLVLTDLRLPDGGGLSLLTYIRERGLPIAVVVITGTGDEKMAVTALKAGADDYVSKRDNYLERLPLTLENALRRRRDQASRQANTLKALYAERHETDIDLTLRHFQRYAPHIQLDIVRTGAEALQRLHQGGEVSRYDVVLLDYRLPGLNALELLREMRQDRALDIPVVLVTGQGDEEVALQALKLGAASYLVKNPSYLHQLPSELENACYRAEIIREQAALKQSEERLRLAQRAARVGTWDWNLVTGESNWSEGIYELLGLAQGDGRANVEDFVGIIHPEDREPARDKVASVIRYGEDYYDEFRVTRQDDSIAWLASKGRVIRGASGRAERMIGVNIDITERKQAEERLRSYFELPLIGMAITSPDRRFVEVNQKLCDILGYSMDQLTGMSWVDVTHPDDVAENIRLLDETLRGETEGYVMDKRFIRRDGRVVYASISARCVRRADRTVDYLALVVQDITERKKGEEALRESEARFRNMADNAPVMVWMTEADGACSYLSQSWYDFTGQIPETGLGFGWVGALHPDDREVSEKAFLAANEKREAFRLEYRLWRNDGEYRWVIDSARPRFDSQGAFLGYIGSVVDITETKRAELNTQFINQLDFELSQIADADEIIRLATSRLGEYLGVTSCYVIEVNPPAGLAFVRESWNGWRNAGHSIVGEYRISDFVTPECLDEFEAGRATVVKDVMNDPRIRDFASRYKALDVGAFISIPALNERQWEANLTVDHPQARDWRPDETQLMRDITARLWPAYKRARAVEALRESEERLRLALEAGRMGVWEWDTRTNVVKWSKETYTIMGLSPFSLEPHYHTWADRVNQDDLPVAIEEMRKAIKEKGEYRYECRIIWADGSVRWVEGRGKPVYDEGGQCLKVSGLLVDITERKQAEDALRRSEAQYRSVVESQTELICRFLPDTTLTFVNEPYCRYFDKTQEELIGLKFLELIPEPAREVTREHIRSLVENPRVEINEHQVMLPDGRIGWQQWVDHAILDASGKVVEFQAVGRDITERKQMEEERRENEERLRLALEAGRMGVWELDTISNTAKWSKEHYTIMGLTPFSVEPDYQTWSDRMHPDDLPLAEKLMSRAIAEKGEYWQEYRVIWPDGSLRWVEDRAKPVYDEEGQCLKVSGLIVDITERKQAEDALRQSEARYRAIVEDQTELVCRVLPDGRYTFVNEAYRRYFDCKSEELIGRTFQPFIHPEDAVKVNQFLESITPNNPVGTLEHRVVLPDGEVRWQQWTERGIFDEQGRLLEFQCVGRDVTQRKQAEERLMESEAQLRLLTELIPQHVWTGYPGNLADFRNQRWLDYTGMTIEEARDKGWMTALHPDDHGPVLNAIKEASSQKRTYEVEERLRGSDGQYRWFLARAIPQLDQEGNIIKWYGTNTDIEDRKQVEEALRLSEDKFSKAFRSSPDAFAISSQTDGMILEVNERWEEILGYTRDEAVGRTAWELQIYLDPGERERLISLVRERGSVRDFEVDIRKKSGEIRNVLLSAEPIMIRDEPCMILIVRDITERKRTGEALRESEERLRLALEAGRMGVWEWDMRTNSIKWSKEHFTIMGMAPFGVEPDYQTWADRVYPDDLPVAMRSIRKAIEENREYRCEYRIIWPDGNVRWVEGRGKPVYDEDGQCLKVSGLIVDITERKQAEGALRENEEALRKSYARIEDLAGRLIAAQEDERRHIARELHDDLNQQVAALAIGISRLKRQFPDAGPAVQEQFVKLREKTDWLSERIRQVSHELHSSILQHIGLSAALNSYCAEFSDREGITVTLDIRDGVEAVSPDAALCLYRVAQESLHNIARHSGARSAIVALTRVNGAIELRVTDQGVGFDPGQAREGRGLGLVSMEERVKLLHGNFVLTTQPGAGTELRAQIPLRGDHEQN